MSPSHVVAQHGSPFCSPTPTIPEKPLPSALKDFIVSSKGILREPDNLSPVSQMQDVNSH